MSANQKHGLHHTCSFFACNIPESKCPYLANPSYRPDTSQDRHRIEAILREAIKQALYIARHIALGTKKEAHMVDAIVDLIQKARADELKNIPLRQIGEHDLALDQEYVSNRLAELNKDSEK